MNHIFQPKCSRLIFMLDVLFRDYFFYKFSLGRKISSKKIEINPIFILPVEKCGFFGLLCSLARALILTLEILNRKLKRNLIWIITKQTLITQKRLSSNLRFFEIRMETPGAFDCIDQVAPLCFQKFLWYLCYCGNFCVMKQNGYLNRKNIQILHTSDSREFFWRQFFLFEKI